MPKELPILVSLTAPLPPLGGVTANIVSSPRRMLVEPGRYLVQLRLDPATVPEKVVFHAQEPVVWLQYPRPDAFGEEKVEQGGRACAFLWHNRGDDLFARFVFLLRLQRGTFTFLSQDPTIYNKGDIPTRQAPEE